MAAWHLCVSVVAVFFSIQTASAIHCWDCNSHYDPRCADPFDNHSIALVDCSQKSLEHLEQKTANSCRKTIQDVQGEIRVIRSCGWLDSSAEDGGASCFKGSGSQDVFKNFCTCSSDGCNGASTLTGMLTSTVAIGSIFVVYMLMNHSRL